MEITSRHNPAVQALRRALQNGQALDNGLIAAEGPHLLDEALRGHWIIEAVWTTPAGRERHRALLQCVEAPIHEIPSRLFQSLSGTDHPQEVLALLRPPEWSWEAMAGPQALIVVLDGIQDPGNAGTIVRSAEAFGATGVIFLPGCVKLANGKFLRATAGSIFRIPFLEQLSPAHLLNLFEQSGLRRYALTARAGARLPDADFRPGAGFIVGSEGGGISPELLDSAEPVSIPAKVESLNAAVACSIALFEAARQRGRQ